MAQFLADAGRLARALVCGMPSINRSRATRRARPLLVIGAILLASSEGRAEAQAAAAVENVPDITTGTLAPTNRVASVVLLETPRVAYSGSYSPELPPSVNGDDVSNLAIADDTVASHQTRHIILGMAVGTVAGAGLGYAIVKATCDPTPETFCEIGMGVAAIGGAFLGLIVGGVIGAHADERMPGHHLRHVTLGAIPRGAHAMVLTASVH